MPIIAAVTNQKEILFEPSDYHIRIQQKWHFELIIGGAATNHKGLLLELVQ